MLSQLIHFLEDLQQKIDFEGYLFDIAFDRWAHFIIAFLLMIFFTRLKRPIVGILVVVFAAFLKAFIDLGIIYYYEPIQLKFWLDSIYDVLVGLLGIGIGFIVQPPFTKRKAWTPSK